MKMREFKIFAEIPDGHNGYFYEEIDEILLDRYPDNIDLAYFKHLALDLFPDAVFLQVFELAEEVKLHKDKK